MLIRAISPLTMMPVGANGDSEPALAPLPTMIAIRKSGMPARDAVPIAIGASSAAVAMLPGPIDAIAAARTKNMIGTTPRLPRQRRTAWCASLSSVPLVCASENSSVTPTSVRNSGVGKSGDHGVERHAADVDADNPRHRDGQHADVERRDAADEDGDRQRDDRDDGEIHAVSMVSE